MSDTLTSAAGADDSDPDAIERHLDETRSRLDSDLSQLQARLSPGQIVDDLLAYFRGDGGADAGDIGRSLMDSVRANPIPVAVTGVGLVWLAMSRPRRDADTASADDSGEDALGTRTHGEAEGASMRGGEPEILTDPSAAGFGAARLNPARDRALGVTRGLKGTVDTLADRAKSALDKAETAISKAGEKASRAGDRLGGVGQSAQDGIRGAARSARDQASGVVAQGRRVGSKVAGAIPDEPLLLGAIGLAAGALAGALLPISDQEEAALGLAAARARESAQAMAREGVEQGRHLAEVVVEQGRESLQEHRLAGERTTGELVDAALSGELASEARAVAHEVLQAGEQAAREAAQAHHSGAAPGEPAAANSAPAPATANPVGAPVG